MIRDWILELLLVGEITLSVPLPRPAYSLSLSLSLSLSRPVSGSRKLLGALSAGAHLALFSAGRGQLAARNRLPLHRAHHP